MSERSSRRGLLTLLLCLVSAGSLGLLLRSCFPARNASPLPREAIALHPAPVATLPAEASSPTSVAIAEIHTSPLPLPKPPRYKPRPLGEWDGMLVDLETQPPCEDSAHCGLARACKGGRCVACEADSDCESGAACVLDHCVAAQQVRCGC